jgi:hypothetical protein
VGPRASSFTVQVLPSGGTLRTLLVSSPRRSLVFIGQPGRTYQFRVRGASASGLAGVLSTATTVTPTGVHPKGGHYTGPWRVSTVNGAWEDRAIKSSKPGSKLTLRYVGGALEIIGELGPKGGRARVTFDGHSTTIRLRAAQAQARQVLYRRAATAGVRRLTLRVLSGVVALEGLAINSRTG